MSGKRTQEPVPGTGRPAGPIAQVSGGVELSGSQWGMNRYGSGWLAVGALCVGAGFFALFSADQEESGAEGPPAEIPLSFSSRTLVEPSSEPVRHVTAESTPRPNPDEPRQERGATSAERIEPAEWLLDRVEKLERRLSDLEAPPQDGSNDQIPRNDLEMGDEAARIDTEKRRLEEAFASESRDAEWGFTVGNSMRMAFDTEEIFDVASIDLECRDSMCQMNIVPIGGEFEIRSIRDRLEETMADGYPFVGGVFFRNSDGSYTYFLETQ